MARSASLIASCFAILAIGITASILGQAQEEEGSIVIDFQTVRA